MPVINGKVVRARYTSFKMAELSHVDRPAQPGALAVIRKRDDTMPSHKASVTALAVAKYIGQDDGAHTFDEVLNKNKFSEAIWPMTDALTQSIRSIMGDKNIKPADRETQVTTSVDEFLSAIRDIAPDTEKRLVELISKKDSTMDLTEALAEIKRLKGEMKTMEPKAAKADTLQTELDTEKAAHADTKKSFTEKTDEVIKVDDTEVRKSVVGEAQFAVTKALMSRAETAEVEKRADAEFKHVPGTTVEKGLVLKAMAKMDEPTAKALGTILAMAEKTAKGFFVSKGHSGDGSTGDVAKALSTFNGKVAEIAKRDGIGMSAATTKARSEFPDEFAAAYQTDTAE